MHTQYFIIIIQKNIVVFLTQYEQQKKNYDDFDRSTERYIEIDTNHEKSDTFYKLFSMLDDHSF